MKNTIAFLILSLLIIKINAQSDSTGLAGDQLNLPGILEAFQKSNSPEEFEKMINSESSKLNNIDLNNDGETDYIKVISSSNDDSRIFILQVPVSESENQDIAVIELEKTGNQEAQIQIIGDEEIFGEDYILEPQSEEDSNLESKESGPSIDLEMNSAVIVNVWAWPCVRFVFAPEYVPYISPWRWRVYPGWWTPWRPLSWHRWHPFRFRPTIFPIRHYHAIRTHHAHRIYTPMRTRSTVVHTRYAGAHKNYTVTKRRTKVTGPHGHTKTKTTTTVKGPKGHVKAKRTTVRRK